MQSDHIRGVGSRLAAINTQWVKLSHVLDPYLMQGGAWVGQEKSGGGERVWECTTKKQKRVKKKKKKSKVERKGQ